MATTDQMIAAVHAYVEAFDKSDVSIIDNIFAEDATVEDPIGTPIHNGKAAILAFYSGAMQTGAKLALQEPVRVVADYAAFAFSVVLNYGGSEKKIDVIDTFKFNGAGKVVEMRAYWGPTNMNGF
jgi:steroid Delta-isomerase